MTIAPPQRVSFLDPGTRLGKYEIIRGVAVGGMAELYLARIAAKRSFDRVVALKRVLPHYAAQDEFLHMFLDEARLTAKLQHPNIAQVFDIGSCAAGLFFTMEYIPGEDVRRLMHTVRSANARIPLQHVLAIVLHTARGLHAAHELCGSDGEPMFLVHRDVSPSNILISYNGNVKIIDFGVAKARGRLACTRSGVVKGKVSYMSPEQSRGEEVDRRSDVFALGILLHELTTGRRLFRGTNEFAVLKRIISSDAPLPSLRVDDYPPELEKIVMRALARDVEQRYQSAAELADVLSEFAEASKLDTSWAAMAAYMQRVFPESLREWHDFLLNLKPQVTGTLDRIPLIGMEDADDGAPRAVHGAPRAVHCAASRPDIPGSDPAVLVSSLEFADALDRACAALEDTESQSREPTGTHSAHGIWRPRGFVAVMAVTVLALVLGGLFLGGKKHAASDLGVDANPREVVIFAEAEGRPNEILATPESLSGNSDARVAESATRQVAREHRAEGPADSSKLATRGRRQPASSTKKLAPENRVVRKRRSRRKLRRDTGDRAKDHASDKAPLEQSEPDWDPDAALPPRAR